MALLSKHSAPEKKPKLLDPTCLTEEAWALKAQLTSCSYTDESIVEMCIGSLVRSSIGLVAALWRINRIVFMGFYSDSILI